MLVKHLLSMYYRLFKTLFLSFCSTYITCLTFHQQYDRRQPPLPQYPPPLYFSTPHPPPQQTDVYQCILASATYDLHKFSLKKYDAVINRTKQGYSKRELTLKLPGVRSKLKTKFYFNFILKLQNFLQMFSVAIH